MIKRFVESVSNVFAGKQRLRKTPKRIDAAEHKIDKTLVARSALRVCETLQKAGYEAYLVGGAVRDLLLGIAPKDFDVATNATPEQVKTQFRRAIIIGRRFRLVHVMFGAETIEVSTYRALDNPERQTDAHGRVLADNLFGPQHEDVGLHPHLQRTGHAAQPRGYGAVARCEADDVARRHQLRDAALARQLAVEHRGVLHRDRRPHLREQVAGRDAHVIDREARPQVVVDQTLDRRRSGAARHLAHRRDRDRGA